MPFGNEGIDVQSRHIRANLVLEPDLGFWKEGTRTRG
jgi:hypothetical protein